VKTIDRTGDALNSALHELFAHRERLMMLGEDIADPYGGAFGITRGLSGDYPGRIISTPISENAIAGVAGGLALAGDEVIVEVMFGDFIALCFDPIVNFLAKSVSMYGRPVPIPVVFRCPVGGSRGYGPTHSQNMQKHFIGVPNLSLFELSPLHPVRPVFERMLDSGEPSIFFEDKALYTQPRFGFGPGDGLFRRENLSGGSDWARVSVDDAPGGWAIVAPGGLVRRALGAMSRALIDHEIACQLLTPARLYPLDLEPIAAALAGSDQIMVVEDGVAGGGWTAEVAREIHERLWGRLRRPVRLVQPKREVIPAARHLESRLLVQEHTIYDVLREDR
jgi:pyruvate/2-oxoglutarate/acetoin dehydrogenase E1 component